VGGVAVSPPRASVWNRHLARLSKYPPAFLDWPTFVQFASRYFNDVWPVVAAGQSFVLGDAPENVVGNVAATDPDSGDFLHNLQIKGGSGVGLFTINRENRKINCRDE
jgi:hypothetical protein